MKWCKCDRTFRQTSNDVWKSVAAATNIGDWFSFFFEKVRPIYHSYIVYETKAFTQETRLLQCNFGMVCWWYDGTSQNIDSFSIKSSKSKKKPSRNQIKQIKQQVLNSCKAFQWNLLLKLLTSVSTFWQQEVKFISLTLWKFKKFYQLCVITFNSTKNFFKIGILFIHCLFDMGDWFHFPTLFVQHEKIKYSDQAQARAEAISFCFGTDDQLLNTWSFHKKWESKWLGWQNDFQECWWETDDQVGPYYQFLATGRLERIP